jgi:hypothetical protein
MDYRNIIESMPSKVLQVYRAYAENKLNKSFPPKEQI